MKKSLLFLGLALIFSCFVKAQSNKEEIDLFQSVFGMEKKAIVSDFLKLDDAKAPAFWALYDQYETARKEHGKKRIELLQKYAESYATLDDAKTDEIMKEMIALGNEYDKLILSYYKKIKKTSGSKVAAQFFQLETYFQSMIRTEIFGNIPFIGELEK
jgi:hypothetical protein